MYAYYLLERVTIRTSNQYKAFSKVADLHKPGTDQVYIAAQQEMTLLSKVIGEQLPAMKADEVLRIFDHPSTRNLAGIPPILGAAAFENPEAAPSDCLLAQLESIRAAHPARGHFRFLLVNAFGTNLGDNLIGLTAFRHVLAAMRRILPGVSCDVMLGWYPDDRLGRLFSHVEGIEFVRTQGMRLSEFSRYQGYFDTSNLIQLAGYGTRPAVDWYLWWMGLDPAAIAASEKRNRVAIPAPAGQVISRLMQGVPGPCVLINAKASVALRSMPAGAMSRFIERLLSFRPEVTVLVLQECASVSGRVIDVSAAIPDIDHLAALVASVDGVISVDTYTTHLADATSTPCVTLYSSFDTEVYPYYPLNAGLLIPDAAALPAWGLPKVDGEAWAAMEGEYVAAWERLDVEQVMGHLDRVREAARRIHEKAGRPALLGIVPKNPVCPLRPQPGGEPNWLVPERLQSDPLAGALEKFIVQVAERVLLSGDTVVLLAPGLGLEVPDLARRVGRHGRIVAIEPRRQMHQLLCGNLVNADIWHVECHWAMPCAKDSLVSPFKSLLPMDEAYPLRLSNTDDPEAVVCWSLDALKLTTARLLIFRAPLCGLSVLKEALQTLIACRPVVVAGILGGRTIEAVEKFFKGIEYQVRVFDVSKKDIGHLEERYVMLLAEPPVEPLTA